MINNVYDLYNATLEADAPFVTAIVNSILATITTKIAENVNEFVAETDPLMPELESLQKNRIIDRVLFELRNKGIRAYIIRTMTDGQQYFVTSNFNYISDVSPALHIRWSIRKNQEYMKTYC